MLTIDDPGESYNITVVEGRRGGAGLGVYGVLSGKRNYTVFVPMPGGRWIMQFSEMGNPAPSLRQLSRHRLNPKSWFPRSTPSRSHARFARSIQASQRTRSWRSFEAWSCCTLSSARMGKWTGSELFAA